MRRVRPYPSEHTGIVLQHPQQLTEITAGYPLDQTYRMHLPQQHTSSNAYDLSATTPQYSPNQMRTSSPTTTFASPSQSYHAHNPYGLGYGSMPSSVTRSMSSPMPAATMGSTHPTSYAPQYDR